MKKHCFLLVIILTVLIMLWGSVSIYAQEDPSKKNPYNFSSNEFKNEDLGFSIKAPKGWMIFGTQALTDNLGNFNRDQIKKLEEMKKTLDKNKDAKKLKQVEKSLKELKTAQADIKQTKKKKEDFMSLFNATHKEGASMSTVAVKAMTLKSLGNMKTGKEYLEIYQSRLSTSGKKLKLYSKKLGGKSFSLVQTKIEKHLDRKGKKETLLYRMYAAPVKDYMMVITTTCLPDTAKNVDKFLAAMKFKP